MSHRTVQDANYRLYDAGLDVEANECELAKIMFAVGLDPSNMNSITIDEILEAIDLTFGYDDRSYIHVDGMDFYSFPQTASNDLLKKTNAMLVIVSRRLWRWRHLAKYQETL